jgi:proteasome beta subunit
MHDPDFGPQSGGRERQAEIGRRTEFRPQVSAGEASDAPTFETGTTVVALTAGDGVVLAADRKASLGGRFTSNKNAEKILRVHPTAAMAISGSVGPAQSVAETLRAEASLYEARRGEAMSMTALSQTAGQLLRGLPVVPLLGGVDDEGGHVYELDGGGSVMEDAYAAGGSGMQLAYGVLERRYDGVSDLADATEAAVDAVAAASERDTASGNGVTVATITDDGVAMEVADVAEVDALESVDESAGTDGEVA